MIRYSTFGPHIDNSDLKFVRDAMKPKNWYHNPYKYCELFEKKFSNFHERKYGLFTPNCTSAIHLLLHSLNLKPTDEVIVSENTWIATASPIMLTQAKLVLCDVDKENWCISISKIKKIINKNTKVIIATSVFGNMPNYSELEKICKKNKILLLEDAAESLGSTLNKKKSGSFGDASVFSFHRTKTITCGEGGILLLNNKKLFLKCKMMRDHGRSEKTKDLFNDKFALKYMPFNLQAALAYSQFKKLKKLLKIKRKIFLEYKKNLSTIKSIQFNQDDLLVKNGCWATVLVFKNIKMSKLKKIFKELSNLGYFARPFFYPISKLPAYKDIKEKKKVKFTGNYNSNYLNKNGIVLPSSYVLKKKDIKLICDTIKKLY